MTKEPRSDMEYVNDAYQQRVDARASINGEKTEEAEKIAEESGIVSVETVDEKAPDKKAPAKRG